LDKGVRSIASGVNVMLLIAQIVLGVIIGGLTIALFVTAVYPRRMLPLTQNQQLGYAEHAIPKRKSVSKRTQHKLRRDSTIELVTQLNELIKSKDGSQRTKMHRMISNLIAKATTAFDVLDDKGNTCKRTPRS
jgi:hypothetical protein